jgi:hypothetical protein
MNAAVRRGREHFSFFALLLILVFVSAVSSRAQARRIPEIAAPVIEERVVGPYDVRVLADGPALNEPIPPTSRALTSMGAYTISLWVELSSDAPRDVLLAGFGDPLAENSRFLGIDNGRPMIRYGVGNTLVANSALPQSGWHFLAATSDGTTVSLSVDGKEAARGTMLSGAVAARLVIAPTEAITDLPVMHFGGNLAQVMLRPESVTQQALRENASHSPDSLLLHWQDASLSWPVQTRGQAGYIAPQDPSLMPTTLAPFGKPSVKPLPPSSAPALEPVGQQQWALRSHWKLTAATDVGAAGSQISSVGFEDRSWMHATVPGTVLTSMVDRGIYSDPDFGLNNLAIPESLNKQDYWYRIEFATPREVTGHRVVLTFLGINYAAEVWLNGKRVGNVRGAFIRGSFDVTDLLRRAGKNALGVRISPPPHPGIPMEQSIKAGPGENGGAMCLDGPTFVATEGWDWIPAIRDRNSGIWQDVVLSVNGALQLGDARVVTHLPLPETSSADVSIDVPIHNSSAQPVQGKLHAAFEGVSLDKSLTIAPGDSLVSLSPAEYANLHLLKPRLWWPNGYGRPDLYHLKLSLAEGATVSDHKDVTFGVREITYELSLFDDTGHLRREEVFPTVARQNKVEVVDVRHQAMRQTAEYWAPSLTPEGERSSAVTPVSDEPGFTDLVIKVNGVRIAARGGNWGMDDSRKRVSREHLEPFFRLHREANLNIIRNWVGQNTEETFYELADEYGLMVWNDFWASTQDYNVEPQDVPLFLANARDVVRRFRNHPSIVIWCGRNEGVPQPVLNEGLIDMLREEDGTRYYTPGSNRIDLRNSGPYLYQDPTLYYTTLDKGFSVELGIASLSTLESLQATIAAPDQWPVSDAWAYHDWHQSGNGDVHSLVQHMEQEFGGSTSLPDFERKAQMFNYVDHRAIFEGFNQHLFSPNSGRMLWMTQPAWPSNNWQILSSDYDTQASFYGVKKACEPLHLQLDLSDYTVTAVNTTGESAHGLHVEATVYDLSGKELSLREEPLELPPNKAMPLFPLTLGPLFLQEQAVLVRLQMTDSAGLVISRNVYWLAGKESDYRKLTSMPAAQLSLNASTREIEGESAIEVVVRNTGTVPALATKLTLQNAATHERILPAYYSDNYVSLLPGESLHLTIRYPSAGAGSRKLAPAVGVRGWNVPESVTYITTTPLTRNDQK